MPTTHDVSSLVAEAAADRPDALAVVEAAGRSVTWAELEDEVARVYAELGSFIHELPVEDCGLLTLDFAGGAFASIDCSWSRPATYPTWGGVTMHVVGERGTVDVDVFRQSLTHHDDVSGVTKLVGWGDDLNALTLGAFVDAIIAGRPVPISGEDGVRSLEVVAAAYRSAELGRPVAISEVA